MKVYGVPNECPAPQVDYKNYDYDKMVADEEAHKEALKQHLIGMGYTGKYTGGIVSFGVADGRASYMMADAGAKSALIHLPYGDAYQYNGIQHFPRSAVIQQIESQKKIAKLFAKKKDPV